MQHYAVVRYRSRSRGRAEYPPNYVPPGYPPPSYPPAGPSYPPPGPAYPPPGYPPERAAYPPPQYAPDPYAMPPPDPYAPPPRDPYARDPYAPPPRDPYAPPPHDPYAPPPVHDPYAPPPHDPYAPRDPYAPPPRPPAHYPAYPQPGYPAYPEYPPAHYPPPGYPPGAPPAQPPPYYPPPHGPPHGPHPPPHVHPHHPPPHYPPPHHHPPPHYPAFGPPPMPGYGALRQKSRSPNRRVIRRMTLKRPDRKAKAKPKPKAKQEKKAPPVKADGSEMSPRELSDIKEAEAKAKREANPEATREAKPLQLLVERASNPKSWIPCIEDVSLRAWMYMSQEKHVTHNDFEEIKEKVDWVEIHGAAAVTRKTMWFVKEGCRCPYSYGKQQVSAVTFPDWFLEMAKRWLGCLNLNDQDKDSMFPNCVNLNLYEHGDHQVAWHSDDEPLFRGKFQDTRIISVTLGAMRKFQVGLKAPRRGGILKPEKGSMATFNLGHGQICTMEGLFQKHYLHQIAKGTTRQPRINATFRTIVEHAASCPLRR